MKAAPAFAALLTIALILAACSRHASVVVTGSLAAPEARLTTPEGEAWRRACVTHVQVFQGRNVQSPDWAIETVDGECRWVDQVVYGQVPDGFMERATTEALHEGVTYRVFVRGWTRGVASVPFYAGANYAYSDGQWRSVQ